MAECEIYCPRGIFIKDGKFDASQIEEGLAIGLHPQPIIAGYNPELVSAFVGWMNLKRNSGLELKLTAHARSDLLDEAKAKSELDAVVEINKEYDPAKPIITEVVYHAGKVMSAETELDLRKRQGFNKGDAPFNGNIFFNALNRAEEVRKVLASFGEQNSIDVLVENVPVIEFEECFEGLKPEELKKDVRWANTRYVPGQVQVGLLGCCDDLKYILGPQGKACIDIEHLDQTEEYFRMHNTGILTGTAVCNMLIQLGQPIQYLRKDHFFSALDFIKSLSGRIKVAHLGGQVSMFYQDEGITKIGSHMPLTFRGDENVFIVDDKVREEQNALREDKDVKYVLALYDAGCRKFVLEFHTNTYIGPVWRKYMEISARNLQSILSKRN